MLLNIDVELDDLAHAICKHATPTEAIDLIVMIDEGFCEHGFSRMLLMRLLAEYKKACLADVVPFNVTELLIS